jgi:hypothetical protein
MQGLPRALKESRADGVVLDAVQVGLGLVPMRLGMPYVHVLNALHFDFSGVTPFYVCSWKHEATPEAFERNQEGLRGFMKVFEPVISVARHYAEENGMDVDWNDPWATISRLAC